MNFSWNNETIRWYTNASEYAGFYKSIAADIATLLNGFRNLADLGCGPGLFDFEIHPLLERIECIDINESALQSIRAKTERLGISNISTRKEDCYHMTGQWDVIYMSFFGGRELDCFLPMCKKLFAVVAATSDSEMFPLRRRYSKKTVDDTVNFLKARGIQYTLISRRYEFGQPFTSLDDAKRCFRHYVPDILDDELDENLTRRLKETGGEVYPYYLPRKKSIGIFEINGALT